MEQGRARVSGGGVGISTPKVNRRRVLLHPDASVCLHTCLITTPLHNQPPNPILVGAAPNSMADGPPIVMSNASSTAPGNTVGSLFTGLKFFLVHKLPARTQLIADIEANGGSVVRLEKQADFVIADHARRDAPTGSYSWKLISTAIEDGAMPDPADYPAGPPLGTVRDIASGVPGKSKRTAFTLEDDKELWQWVQEQAPGGYGVKGNEIYRRLEQRNPRHTMQAWRDRYMKKLMDHPPAGINLTVPARPPPSPPTALDEQGSTHGIRTPPVKRRRVEASTEQAVGVGDDVVETSVDQDQIDMNLLLQEAPDIEDIDQQRHDETWNAWSIAYPHRSSGEWIEFWLERVRPSYIEQCADRKVQEAAEELDHEHELQGRKRKRRRNSRHDNGEQEPADVQSQPDAQSANGESEASNEELASNTTPERYATKDHSAANFSVVQVKANESGQADSDISTSDANQAATRQIMSLLVERDKPSSNASAIGEDDYQDDVDTEQTDGTALTEANLAAQEARYQPPVRRGIDLAVDDPAKDQTEMLEFLQALCGGKPGLAPAAQEAASSFQPVSRYSRTVEQVIEGLEQVMEDLEHMSQDDLDETIRQNMDWPSSPQQENAVENTARAGETLDELITAHQQPRTTGFNVAANARPLSRDDGHDEDLSDHDIDLSVALPDHGMGFGPSSDHSSLRVVSEALPEPQQYANDANRANAARDGANRMPAEVVDISSASPRSSSLDSSEHVDDAMDLADQARTGRLLQTQDIYSAETQYADLFMPLPPEFDEDEEYGDENQDASNEDELPEQPIESIEYHASRTQDTPATATESSKNSEEDEAAELESWMATMKVRGHDDNLVIEALKCTSMNLGLAELVLMHVKGGKGIPDDVPGVWTHEEDEQVEGGNARALRVLETKHGWPACTARLRFLERYRNED